MPLPDRRPSLDDPSTDPRPATPLYAALAKTLADAIRAGEPPEGALLPTEPELAALHGVSRQTVREALRRLEADGLVVRRRGVGTRVQRLPSLRPYVLDIASSADIADYARRMRLHVETVEPVTAGPRVAAYIGCREGSPWLAVRGFRADRDRPDQPLAMVGVFVRADYAGMQGRLKGVLDRAIYQLIEQECGESFDDIEQVITAVPIEAAAAARLGVPAGSPGLRIDRHFRGRGGRIGMVGHVVYPGPSFSHALRLRRGVPSSPDPGSLV